MGNSTEQPIRYLDSRVVSHAQLLSFSVNFQAIGSGNPNKFRVYCSGMFLLYRKGLEEEDERLVSVGNKASNDDSGEPVSFFVLGEFDTQPTHRQIIDALFSSKDRFELWKAQCIYNLSGEVLEGFKVDNNEIISKK
jgi:hypothetical protein